MGKFDNDSDGLLDLEEFKALMNRNQKKKTDNWAKTNTSIPYKQCPGACFRLDELS